MQQNIHTGWHKPEQQFCKNIISRVTKHTLVTCYLDQITKCLFTWFFFFFGFSKAKRFTFLLDTFQNLEYASSSFSWASGWAGYDDTRTCIKLFSGHIRSCLGDFPGGSMAKTPHSQCRGLRFNPRSGN